jgi:hypothetical protein
MNQIQQQLERTKQASFVMCCLGQMGLDRSQELALSQIHSQLDALVSSLDSQQMELLTSLLELRQHFIGSTLRPTPGTMYQ